MKAILSLLIMFCAFNVGAQNMSKDVVFEPDFLVIKTQSGGIHKFNIEIAKTPQQLEYGLMFRQSMAEDAGMLFLFDRERVVSMWMKNTYIPLDIIFIDRNGLVKKIRKNNKALSLKSINSSERVFAVFEINAKIVDKLSINENDVVLHSAFNNLR